MKKIIKMKVLLCAVICSCFAPVCMAQAENDAPNGTGGEDVPEIFVLDGEHTSFAYGRVTAANKIAVGLTDEGIYELRNDSAVWSVDNPGQQDELVCKIIDDFETGNKLFVRVMPDMYFMHADTLCAYNPAGEVILDKTGNFIGAVKSDGTVVSEQGKTLLMNLQSVDRLLVAFFFACHYTPVRKQLIFSYCHEAIISNVYQLNIH